MRMTTTVVHDLPNQGDKEGRWTDLHHDEEVHPLDQTWQFLPLESLPVEGTQEVPTPGEP